MQADNNTVVRFHYDVALANGTPIESSRSQEPLSALIGARNIVPGLEAAFIGKQAGDRFEATVTPEQGYGERHQGLVQRIPKKYFHDAHTLKPGMTTILNTKEGPRALTVLKVGMSVVDVDLNHPLAGETLVFTVDVLEVRAAEAGEIEHGHVHGEGGHQH